MKENILLQLNEEIKPIQGYEGLYSITSFGRVWSHKRLTKFGCAYKICGGKFLKFREDKNKYLLVDLHKENKVKTFKSHILTAQHYIPNPQNFPEVNHKDGDKQNNFAGTIIKSYIDSNLEWCTHSDNVIHAMESGLIKKKTSKYYGVSFDKSDNNKCSPWRSIVGVNKRQKCVGYFKTEIEAAQAYNNYVIEHGLNKPLNNIGE